MLTKNLIDIFWIPIRRIKWFCLHRRSTILGITLSTFLLSHCDCEYGPHLSFKLWPVNGTFKMLPNNTNEKFSIKKISYSSIWVKKIRNFLWWQTVQSKYAIKAVLTEICIAMKLYVNVFNMASLNAKYCPVVELEAAINISIWWPKHLV